MTYEEFKLEKAICVIGTKMGLAALSVKNRKWMGLDVYSIHALLDLGLRADTPEWEHAEKLIRASFLVYSKKDEPLILK